MFNIGIIRAGNSSEIVNFDEIQKKGIVAKIFSGKLEITNFNGSFITVPSGRIKKEGGGEQSSLNISNRDNGRSRLLLGQSAFLYPGDQIFVKDIGLLDVVDEERLKRIKKQKRVAMDLGGAYPTT